MINHQRNSILPLIVLVVLCAITLFGSSVRAGSFGLSAGFRGGGGGHHRGHVGHHRSFSRGHSGLHRSFSRGHAGLHRSFSRGHAGHHRSFSRGHAGHHRSFSRGHVGHHRPFSRGHVGHHRPHAHGHFGHHRFSRRGHSGHGRPHHRSRFGYHRPYNYRGYARHYGRRGYYPRRYGYSGYYSYGSVYGFTPGYYSGGVPYGDYYGQSYNLPGTIANYRVVEDAPQQNPWILLAEGQIQSARRLFAREAEQFPSRGIPKLGYSLSAALDGDLQRAEWAMRRAFRAEPESLGSLSMDPLLMRRLDFIVSYYEDNLDTQATDPNAAFMLAALKFIDQDFKRATDYVELAIDSGDSDESTLKLKQQLRSAGGR